MTKFIITSKVNGEKFELPFIKGLGSDSLDSEDNPLAMLTEDGTASVSILRDNKKQYNKKPIEA